ncbi:hypothetical protein [Jeotgalibaca porci]|uniref:hypothetical protein n=1 Tax=Jeotgalibaca porci TaxID=1868793 RepID=UPI0035A0B510
MNINQLEEKLLRMTDEQIEAEYLERKKTWRNSDDLELFKFTEGIRARRTYKRESEQRAKEQEEKTQAMAYEYNAIVRSWIANGAKKVDGYVTKYVHNGIVLLEWSNGEKIEALLERAKEADKYFKEGYHD